MYRSTDNEEDMYREVLLTKECTYGEVVFLEVDPCAELLGEVPEVLLEHGRVIQEVDDGVELVSDLDEVSPVGGAGVVGETLRVGERLRVRVL